MVVKRVIVPSKTTVKELYTTINSEYYYEVVIENNGVVLHGEKLHKLLTNSSPYDEILTALKKHFD
jgi:hypothetical protein